jgi:ASC-1-like (ASCH) protein
MNLSEEQLRAIESGDAVPITVGRTECLVIRREVYEKFRDILADELPSVEEQRYMLREVGKMAGWDDPEMDVYDQP